MEIRKAPVCRQRHARRRDCRQTAGELLVADEPRRAQHGPLHGSRTPPASAPGSSSTRIERLRGVLSTSHSGRDRSDSVRSAAPAHNDGLDRVPRQANAPMPSRRGCPGAATPGPTSGFVPWAKRRYAVAAAAHELRRRRATAWPAPTRGQLPAMCSPERPRRCPVLRSRGYRPAVGHCPAGAPPPSADTRTVSPRSTSS